MSTYSNAGIDSYLTSGITDEVRAEIIAKTIAALPNNPSAAGYSAETIKKYMYQAIAGVQDALDDTSLNMTNIINDIIDEINAQLTATETAYQAYSDANLETAKEYAESYSDTNLQTAKDYADSAVESALTEGLDIDDTPTVDSDNLVKSGGVYSAIADVQADVDTKQDALTFDSTPTSESTNPVTSGGVYTYGEAIRAVAEGKTASYSISDATNTDFNSSDDTISGVTSFETIGGDTINVSDLNNGDIVLIVETDVPDRWYCSDDGLFYKLETAKVDLSDYATTSEVSSTYMTQANPTGTGKFSMNRLNGTTVGSCSSTLGSDCTATATCSHAEGDATTSSGDSSHSEGIGTTASGTSSHAEGGSTTASGTSSHSEGTHTEASGARAHSEGYYTKASSDCQHAGGKYNVEDTASTYAEIIGNGTSDSARSNARALDWDGNEYIAGDLYVGCDSDSTNGTKVKVWTTDTTEATSVTLTDHTCFRIGTQSTLTILDADSYDLDFECEIDFTADSTIAIDYSAVSITWSGDDVSSNVFTPVAETSYQIFFWNNATTTSTPSIQAIVRGV